jgi:hypothetical protein
MGTSPGTSIVAHALPIDASSSGRRNPRAILETGRHIGQNAAKREMVGVKLFSQLQSSEC